MIQDTVVIGGECSLETRIEGDCDLTSMVEGDPDVLVVEGGGQTYPHYDGPYTVTPATSAQVLDTDGKVMDDDVTVQAVQAGSATTPATIITANPSISVSSGGLITATVSKTQQITPTVQEGYVSAGTAGNVGVSGSNTEQLSVQGAQTIHPASTDQTIASGKYLTGAQTIKAVTVSGLSADKVLQGTTVKIGDVDDDDRIANVVGTAQQGITPTGTKQITANGTGIDVSAYATADVAVPNSYSASDEGKVVSNGALVAQSSDSVTQNGTVDTTLINSLTVNVSGGGGISIDDIVTNTAPSGSISVGSSVTRIRANALRNKPVTRCSAPNVTQVDEGAFSSSGLTRIESTDFPKLTYLNGAFEGCTSLTYIELTGAITNFQYAFRNSSNVEEAYFPNATGNVDRVLYGATKLAVCDCGKGNISNGSSFYNCSALRTLILRKTDGVQTLNAWSANCLGGIYSNPALSTVYIPKTMYDHLGDGTALDYYNATNWLTAHTAGVTFAKIEGSIYE